MTLEDILSVLVAHDSVFGNEKSLAEWLLSYLKKESFEVQKIPIDKKRFSIFAKRGSQSANLLLYGHIDTVPVYDGWEDDPFTLRDKGGKYYGLGACDMKGGIAGLLYALQSVPKDKPVAIFLAADEENESEGTWVLVKKYPDLLDGIEYILSTEPGASKTKIGGTNVLTLGRRGRSRYLVTIQGFSAHGGHVDRGANAVSIGAKIVERIDSQKTAMNTILGPGSQYVAKFKSESKGLSIPEYCELEIDRHTVTPETTSSCLEEIKNLCNETLIDFGVHGDITKYVSVNVEPKRRKNEYMEPYATPENDVFIDICKSAIGSSGQSAIVNYGRSVGDENIFANFLSLKPIIIGPEGGNIHSPNEWVSKKSLAECSEVYKEIILRSQQVR